MELKKNNNKDLSRFRNLFRNAGFVVTLCLVIMAFEWKWPVPKIDLPVEPKDEFAEVLRIEITEHKKDAPAPPKPIKSTILHQVQPVIDDFALDTDAPDVAPDPDANQDLSNIIAGTTTAEPMSDEILDFAEVQAVPLVDMMEWYKKVNVYLSNGLTRYRIDSKGRFAVEFVVETDGSLTQMKEISGKASPRLQALLFEAVRHAGEWQPAKQGGRKVRYRVRLPISIK